MRLDGKRIGIGSAVAAAGCAVAIAASVAATRNDAPVDSGAMADRVIEAQNRGIPADVVRRFETVRAALSKGATDPWAAEYHEGDGLGENVTLALDPVSGVAATWFGCLGLYGANEGDVHVVDERTFALRFRRPNEDRKFGMFPDTLRKVSWSERRYLIDPNRFVDFVNAINSGLEPDSIVGGHMFLLARGDEKKRVSGLPDLPTEWLAQIRARPLLVRVSSVDPPSQHGTNDDVRTCVFRFRFDIPAGETVPIGLRLAPSDESVPETAWIVAVEGSLATAEIEIYDACAEVSDPPKPGSMFSTGGYIPQERVASR